LLSRLPVRHIFNNALSVCGRVLCGGPAMSQQASFYYHIDADGNYWFPLFPTEEEAIAFSGLSVDVGGFGQSDPSAHSHTEFDGNTWYMPNPMASADNGFVGSVHALTLDDASAQGLVDDGAVNITSFSTANAGDDADSSGGSAGGTTGGDEAASDSTIDNGTEGYVYQLQPGDTQVNAPEDRSAALKSNTSDGQLLFGGDEDDFLYSYAGDNNVLNGLGGEDVFQVRSDSNQAISLNSDNTPEIIAISGVSSHIFSIDSPLGLISFAVAGIGDEIPADPASIQINASVRAPSGELVELSPSDSPEGGSVGQLNNQTFSIGYDLSRPIENGIGFTLTTFDFVGKEPLVGRYDLVSMTVNFGDASISQDFEDVFFEIPAEADAFTPSQTYFVNYEAISFTGEPSTTAIVGGDTDAGIGAATASGTGDVTPVFAQDTLILSGQSSKYLVAKLDDEWFQNADVSYGFKNIETGHVIIASEIEVIKFEYGGEVETLTIDDVTLNADFANELNFYPRGGWAPVDVSQLKFVNGGLELPPLEAGVYLGGNMDLTSVTGSDEGEFGDYLTATSNLLFVSGQRAWLRKGQDFSIRKPQEGLSERQSFL
jgi:hypothetical protein